MEQKYVWQVADRMTARQYEALSGFGRLLAKLMFVRGVRTEKEGISMLKDTGLKYDPLLMKNMDRVIAAILEAITKKRKITVYGDYDADGVTASAILIRAFRSAGGIADSYIPDRFTEDYGLNCAALQKIKESGSGLVISVDCGIRAAEEAEYAKQIGLPLIITDHHEPGETLPQPDILLSPKQPGDEYPDKNLAGCGIALKISEALSKAAVDASKIDLDLLTMIAAVGTVADLVPLTDENRSLVKRGLTLFGRKKCLFTEAMAEKAGFDPKYVNSGLISFSIAPRLNAAGRMKHAATALNLLLADSKDEAARYAEEIEKMNSERQKITRIIQESAEAQITENGIPSVICLKDGSYNMGVVGLAAAKLTEKYSRPSFVGHTDGSEIRLSGRSIPEFNMIAALDEIEDVLIKYGGHAMAAGATVSEDKWHEFTNRISAKVNEKVDFERLRPSLTADLDIPSRLISLKLLETVTLLEPFGMGNKQPLFETDGLMVVEHKPVGADGKHLKMKLKSESGQLIDAVAFHAAGRENELPEFIDVIYSIEKNTWHGSDSVQVRIEDMRSSKLRM